MRARMLGFTVVELMATLAVSGVVIGLAAPAFTGISRWMETTTTTHQLTGSLMVARSTAITAGEPVSVCPSRDGATCLNDSGWSNGWIVFLDPERVGHPVAQADVRAVVQRASSLIIKSSSGRPVIRYQPDGRSPGANATFSICSATQQMLLAQVVVNNAGRVRTARAAPGTAC